MRKMRFAAVASALILSTPATAGFFDLTLAPFVGASYGLATSDIDCSAGLSCDDTDSAWRIFGGLEINEFMAMEVGYIDLGEVQYSGADSGSRATNGMTMTLLGTYYFTPSFSLIARGGLNFLNTEVNGTIAGTPVDNSGDTDVVWSFGLGAQYYLTPAVGVRLEWESFFEAGSSDFNGGTGEADIDLISASLVYKF